VGVLGGEGDGSKHVHDQVNPEKLNHIEGRVAKNKGARENKEEARNVGGHLEGNELANVVLQVSAPSDGGDDCQEVVVRKNHVGVVLGSCAAVLTHGGEADVRLTDSPGISETYQ